VPLRQYPDWMYKRFYEKYVKRKTVVRTLNIRRLDIKKTPSPDNVIVKPLYRGKEV